VEQAVEFLADEHGRRYSPHWPEPPVVELALYDMVAQAGPIYRELRTSFASPPTSMAMCRRKPTGRRQTPWRRLSDEGLPTRSLRPQCLAQAVADPDQAFGDASVLAQQQRLPGWSPLLRQGASVMSENVAKLIGRALTATEMWIHLNLCVLDTTSQTVHLPTGSQVKVPLSDPATV
jgi:hypothetical protein